MLHDTSAQTESWVPRADWRSIDAQIGRLAKKKGELDLEEARWLLAAEQAKVHLRLGFASIGEYVERRLGYDRRMCGDRLRVARALSDLPRLREALGSGGLPWTAVRELARVVSPQTEEKWLRAVDGKSVHAIEGMVAHRHPGDGPDDPPDPTLKTIVLRLHLSPELAARYRQAVDRVRGECGGELMEEDALRVMIDGVLDGRRDPGRAPTQVHLTVCPDCGRTLQRARGGPVEVDPEVGERALCDAVIEGLTPLGRDTPSAPLGPGSTGERGEGEIHVAASSRPAGERSEPNGGHDDAAGDRSDGATHVAGSSRPAGERSEPSGGHDGSRPEPETSTHVGRDRTTDELRSIAEVAARSRRAFQTLTPKVRRQVFERDGGCCVITGCRNTRWCEVHHVKPRSHGGTNDHHNLAILCSAHHALLHKGRIRLEGSATTGWRVFHADGRPYGAPASRAAFGEIADAIQGLRTLGFDATRSRMLIAEAQRTEPRAETAPELLRGALRIAGRGGSAGSAAKTTTALRDDVHDAVQGMRSLGFDGALADRLVREACAEDHARTAPELIAAALKRWGSPATKTGGAVADRALQRRGYGARFAELEPTTASCLNDGCLGRPGAASSGAGKLCASSPTKRSRQASVARIARHVGRPPALKRERTPRAGVWAGARHREASGTELTGSAPDPCAGGAAAASVGPLSSRRRPDAPAGAPWTPCAAGARLREAVVRLAPIAAVALGLFADAASARADPPPARPIRAVLAVAALSSRSSARVGGT